jgi:hypothetical protein
MNFEQHDLKHLSSIIDSINENDPFSFGADGNNSVIDSTVYLIVEQIYNILGSRKEILSIKFIKELEDSLAYTWHTDDSTPTEKDLNLTAVVYLKGCEGSKIQIKNPNLQLISAEPYQLLFFAKTIQHRAYGSFHRNFLKFTFK